MATLQVLLSSLASFEMKGGGCDPNHILSREVTLPVCDSRKACGGSLFFCLVGKTADGHAYAPSAYRNGCRLFVVERELSLPADACQIIVSNTRAALADCAACHYGHPEQKLRLVGITGTKGKTTIALLTRSVLESTGIPTGYVGTNGVFYGDTRIATSNTTPESVELYGHLAQMVACGMKACVLEISSQALWMERTRGLTFEAVLFTNLSRDHIGGVEHPDFQHYRDCKKMLFTDYPAKLVVTNHDDPHEAYMTESVTAPIIHYGITKDIKGNVPTWFATDIRPHQKDGRPGVLFHPFQNEKSLGADHFLPFPGDFNVQNALGVLAVVCEGFGVPCDSALEGLERAVAEGRFQIITHPALPSVSFIIDYAHNGVSLTAILDTLLTYEPSRLICLFGSVGGRTRERRRDLAEAAGPRCDLCILTSDNPAGESPEEILQEIDNAFPEGSCPRIRIADREEAIRYAVTIAREGDMILLAGKGHENYQLIGATRGPFSETAILNRALEERTSALAY